MNSQPRAAEPGVARTVLSLGASMAVSRGFNLGIIAIMGREYGTPVVGVYGIATVVASLAALGMSLGFGTYATRQRASGALTADAVSELHRGRFLLLGAGFLLVLSIGWIWYPAFGWCFSLFGLAAMLDQWNDTAWALIRGTAHAAREAYTNSLTYGLLLAVVIVLAISPAGSALSVAVAYSVAAGIRSSAAVQLAGVSVRGSLKSAIHRVRRSLRAASPYLAADVLGLAYLRGDTLVLTAFVSTGAVGTYVAAAMLTSPAVQVGASMAAGAVAVLSRRAGLAEPTVSESRTFALVLTTFVASGLFISGAISVVTSPLCTLLYGRDTGAAVAQCAIVLSLFLPIRYVTFALSANALAVGAVKQRVYIVGASVISNVVLNLALDGSLGIFGAAWASLMTELVILALFVRLVRISRGRTPELCVVVIVAPCAIDVLVERGTVVSWIGGALSGLVLIAAGAGFLLRAVRLRREGRVAVAGALS